MVATEYLENKIHDLNNLGNNKIQRVMDDIHTLKSLKTLKLYNNIIAELPESIGELRHLTHLYLDSNKLEHLPQALNGLESLEYLCVTDNPLLHDMDDRTKELIEGLIEKGVKIESKEYGYK